MVPFHGPSVRAEAGPRVLVRVLELVSSTTLNSIGIGNSTVNSIGIVDECVCFEGKSFSLGSYSNCTQTTHPVSFRRGEFGD
ncbi:hypothetical protein R1flu_019944 [Riccia fluitans]|uniref:Uncharacterized protein n=1 Tax=Riccia fluitans TaxID=41844 RepID=A0ABD1ZMA2_9MARC